MADLVDILLRMDFELAEMKRRLENSERPGVVHAVDPERQRVRLRLGGTDSEPFLTPWVPYMQVAGAMKVHSPPSVGQQMVFVCSAGDFRQGRAEPYTFSKHNPSPSTKGDEHVTAFGDTKQTVRTGQLKQEVGSSEVRVTDQNLRAQSRRIDLN